MKILVVRHGLAEDSAIGERSLTEEGRAQFQQVCRRMVDSFTLSFDLLLHSPLLRAKQTADIFCDFFSVKKSEESEQLRPEADVQRFFETMSALSVSSLALVGHQPFLSEFVSSSLREKGRNFISISRGGMAFLEFPQGPLPGSGVLTMLLSPRVFLG
ncbi:MAG: phosphohistidine phosphatase SixA [Bdellovibrionales bacterium]|nr:phosphohistidine phosphatase SixA [Bdellovibrionales bacterium]